MFKIDPHNIHETQFHSQSQPDDYEQVLAALSTDIQKRQTHLSEIRLRERRATLLFSVYAILLWIVYTSMWYKDFLPTLTAHKKNSQFEKTVEGVPVFLGPIVYVPTSTRIYLHLTRSMCAAFCSSGELCKYGIPALEMQKVCITFVSVKQPAALSYTLSMPVRRTPSAWQLLTCCRHDAKMPRACQSRLQTSCKHHAFPTFPSLWKHAYSHAQRLGSCQFAAVDCVHSTM